MPREPTFPIEWDVPENPGYTTSSFFAAGECVGQHPGQSD